MISVIIPALNEQKYLGRCLSSLIRQTVKRNRYEIIVVDGGSLDRTDEVAGEFADVIVPQKRSGIGGARADGAEAAQGDLLVFTDADTLFRKDWLEVIQENLVDKRYDVSFGPVLFYDRTPQSDLVQLWRAQYKFFHIFRFYRLIGSNIALKRDTYDRIGGHQDISILEDYDLSVRLFKEGTISFRYDPRQTVFTSSRRFNSLSSYLKIYLYGYYHYSVTKDREKLLQYPPPVSVERMLGKIRG
ncbi:MAG: glycosyltransferase [Methanoregula sp.]|nr:glycosyltransferase [Methanoregula sp.]